MNTIRQDGVFLFLGLLLASTLVAPGIDLKI
jgi:hypothetical protein